MNTSQMANEQMLIEGKRWDKMATFLNHRPTSKQICPLQRSRSYLTATRKLELVLSTSHEYATSSTVSGAASFCNAGSMLQLYYASRKTCYL